MLVKFLKNREQNKTTIFFSELRQSRLREIAAKRDEYVWGPPEFKVYPSSLQIKICPQEFIANLAKYSGIEDIGAVYKVKRGSAVHGEYQEDLKKYSRLLYARPNEDSIALERIRIKLHSKWPEVPFQDLEWSGLSGSADLVLDWKGPCPVEIKSTSIDPLKWVDYQKNTLPHENHILQLGIYMYMMNRLNYYPVKIDRGVIAYQNLLFPPGDIKGEAEYIVHLNKPGAVKKYPDDTLEQLVEDLLTNIADARRQYIEKIESPCQYSKCPKHGIKPPRKSRKKAETGGGSESLPVRPGAES